MQTDAPSSRHIVALDGLRGLAVILVLGDHLGGGRQSSLLAVRLFAHALRFGWAGVSLFFVLSGFLITGILWDSFSNPGWWRRFYVRRSLRIFPLYYVSLAYAFLLALLFAQSSLKALPVYVFYLQDFPWFNKWAGLVPQNWFVLSHFWSLAVEEQFYLVWPFLLYTMRKRRDIAIWVCVAGVATSLLLRLYLLKHTPNYLWPYNAAPCRAGELLIGGLIALIWRGSETNRVRLMRSAPITLAVSLAICIGITFCTHGSFETRESAWLGWGLLVVPILFGSILTLCLRPGAIQRFFENRLLRWYGKISYGVYVFHVLLSPMFVRLSDTISLDLNLKPALHELLQSMTILTGATLLAWLSFNTFEAYFLRMKSRIS